MAKTIFLMLLVLNLVTLAWVYLFGDARLNAGREPERVKAELFPERIRIVPTEIGASSTISSANASAASSTVAERCLAFAEVPQEEAQKLAKAWVQKVPAAHVSVSPVAAVVSYEIVVAGLANRAAAETKLGEIRKLGIKDEIPMRADEDQRYSLLMASFRERDAATAALKNFNQSGVRSAVMVETHPPAQSVRMEVRGDAASVEKVSELVATNKTLTASTCVIP